MVKVVDRLNDYLFAITVVYKGLKRILTIKSP